jgi:hypothetical protein
MCCPACHIGRHELCEGECNCDCFFMWPDPEEDFADEGSVESFEPIPLLSCEPDPSLAF